MILFSNAHGLIVLRTWLLLIRLGSTTKTWTCPCQERALRRLYHRLWGQRAVYGNVSVDGPKNGPKGCFDLLMIDISKLCPVGGHRAAPWHVRVTSCPHSFHRPHVIFISPRPSIFLWSHSDWVNELLNNRLVGGPWAYRFFTANDDYRAQPDFTGPLPHYYIQANRVKVKLPILEHSFISNSRLQHRRF